ncbi:MAG: MrcB family domain-containing protein [Syntrophomonadaceae bacterium]
MIKDVPVDIILDAIKRFDQEYRSSADWSNWQNNRSHKFAIEKDKQLYPVKQIISMATGQPVSSFSGGDEANNYLIKKGFKILTLADIQETEPIKGLGENFKIILKDYVSARLGEPFSSKHPIWQVFKDIEDKISNNWDMPAIVTLRWSVGQGNWAKVPWIAFMDKSKTDSIQKGIYVAHLFCQDMQGLYLCLMQGVTEIIQTMGRELGYEQLQQKAEEIRPFLKELETTGFKLDNNIKLYANSSLGSDYEKATIAYKFYPAEALPGDMELTRDLVTILNAYLHVNESSSGLNCAGEGTDRMDRLVMNIAAQGYTFEPWQIAAYIAALRTKPFVILAGVSGTGKSKLPALISRATGGKCHMIPVRPDWTDSSDVLGYCDLQGQFKPGALLSVVREAANYPEKHFVCIMDEMNLARVEHYFAEVLSQVENRHPDGMGRFSSGRLIGQDLKEKDAEWGQQVLPPNLAIVGTVNMDESAYGFSRKVLDRAFTLEFSEIHLESWGNVIDDTPDINIWPVELWFPRAINLNGLQNLTVEDNQKIEKVITVLTEINSILIQGQLQVGYRVRDEVALFVLHAQEIINSFVTRGGIRVNPLDLALQMKILPRIIGGSTPVRKMVLQLLGWAVKGSKNISEEDAQIIIDDWEKIGRPTFLENARYPRTAARLCLMWERLITEGFTSYWM